MDSSKSTGGMNNLTTLIKRLEAATSRLEDIAASSFESETPRGSSVAAGSRAPSVNNDGVGSPSGPLPPSGLAVTAAEDLPPSIKAFDGMVNEELAAYSGLCEKIGGLAAEQGVAFCTAFKAQRDVILVSLKAKKPSPSSPGFENVYRSLMEGISAVDEVKSRNRSRDNSQGNHLQMLGEGVRIIGWVQLDNKPGDYVDEVIGSAQYWGNRIMKEHRDSDENQVDWVKSFVKLCGSLKSYIKQHHPEGLKWNAQGVDVDEALKSMSKAQSQTNGTSAASTSGAPPPPPPPLPQFDVPPPPPQPVARSPPAGDMNAVFEQLNRGEQVTSGLRKVDKSEMTHKNPSLRAQAPTRSDSNSSNGRGKSPTPPVKQKPESMRQKKASRKELDGNKWTIEHFENETSPVEVDGERQHSILVSRCKSATIRVNGKINAISIDNCSKLDLIVDSLVSAVDVINTSNFRMQVVGTLPSIQLDKVDSGTIYLSKESLNAEVYTSQCTSINITLPPKSDEDDSVECPIPEQIKSTIVDGKIVSEIVKQEG